MFHLIHVETYVVEAVGLPCLSLFYSRTKLDAKPLVKAIYASIDGSTEAQK